jgi:hypothetical protein
MLTARNGIPSRTTYVQHFGSLKNAFRLAGFEAARDMEFVDANRRARQLHSQIVGVVIKSIYTAGGFAVMDQMTSMLLVNGELRVAVVILTAGQIDGHRGWRLQKPDPDAADISIYVRLDEANERPFDYYVIPALDRPASERPLREANSRELDVYRCQDLCLFFALMSRVPVDARGPSHQSSIELFAPFAQRPSMNSPSGNQDPPARTCSILKTSPRGSRLRSFALRQGNSSFASRASHGMTQSGLQQRHCAGRLRHPLRRLGDLPLTMPTPQWS